MHASEISRTYVVLSWEPPTPRGKEPLVYFIEKVSAGHSLRAGAGLVRAAIFHCLQMLTAGLGQVGTAATTSSTLGKMNQAVFPPHALCKQAASALRPPCPLWLMRG